MSPISLSGPSGRYLSFAEREEIALLRAHDRGVREIARLLDRDPATISRELRRNAATRGGQLEYRASVAQWKADLAARRPKTAKLATNDQLRDYVQDRLAGTVTDAEGRTGPGPERAVEGTPSWTARGSPLGCGVEPGADQSPLTCGLPRG
jgi:hypothetical protein